MSNSGDRNHYDPNQPRVPTGHSNGGQWTRGAYAGRRYRLTRDESGREPWNSRIETHNSDGSVAQEQTFNRDGSEVHSRYAPTNDLGWDERHRVRLPGGQVFEIENSDGVQRIYDANGNLVSAYKWGESGAEPLPFAQVRGRLPRPSKEQLDATAALVGGALLFLQESLARKRYDRNGVLISQFNAREYQPAEDPERKPQFVAYLSEEEVRNTCGKYAEVMKALDTITAKVRDEYPTWSAAKLGNEIHKRLAQEINGPGGPDRPLNTSYRAEHSVWKTAQAAAQQAAEEAAILSQSLDATKKKKDDPSMLRETPSASISLNGSTMTQCVSMTLRPATRRGDQGI